MQAGERVDDFELAALELLEGLCLFLEGGQLRVAVADVEGGVLVNLVDDVAELGGVGEGLLTDDGDELLGIGVRAFAVLGEEGTDGVVNLVDGLGIVGDFRLALELRM